LDRDSQKINLEAHSGWGLLGALWAYPDKFPGHMNVASTARYLHLANDTLMAATEAGAAKLNVDWSQSMKRLNWAGCCRPFCR
jgi:hypothetical protein